MTVTFAAAIGYLASAVLALFGIFILLSIALWVTATIGQGYHMFNRARREGRTHKEQPHD